MDSLYKISSDFYECLSQCIDPETGEIKNEELAEKLDGLQMKLENKAINTAYVIKKLDAKGKAIDDEIKRLRKLKETTDNAHDRLKEYLAACVPQGMKIETDLMTISWRKSPGKVEIDDLTKIPEKYKNTEVVVTPNKNAIKEAIKSGTNVEGARLNEEPTIQIR